MAYQIVYSSRATEPMSAAGLATILDDARDGNAARGVTGALVYADGVFLQILEGEEAVVRGVMASISRDARHEAVTVFHEGEVGERAFGSWSMAFLSPDPADVASWTGLDGAGTIDELVALVHREPPRVPHVLRSIVDALADAD